MTDQPSPPLDAARLAPGQVVDGFVLIERAHVGGMASLWRVALVAGLPPPLMHNGLSASLPMPGATAPSLTPHATAPSLMPHATAPSLMPHATAPSLMPHATAPSLMPHATLPLLMKIPQFGGGEDRSALVGFEVEQMILPRLTGPHVPRVLAIGAWGRLPHLVMEEVAGRTLESLATGPLPQAEVVALGLALALALDDLHRQRVVHQDLKPGNVMIRPDGSAVLIDFGLARHADLPDLLAEESDAPMGSPGYIAPEQLGDGAAMRGDPRSDLFALGVILYRLVTGVLPFGEPTRVSDQRRRRMRPPRPPGDLVPDLDPALQSVILRALDPDPARRWASAAQMAFDLRHPGQVRAYVTPAPPRGLARFWPRRGPVRGPLPVAVPLAPIVMAAVDLATRSAPLEAAIRAHVQRQMQASPGARLTCVTVLRTALLAPDAETDAQGRNTYVQRLVDLQDWARPLGRLAELASYHVLEATSPAQALVDYARHNAVDHLVMGARASSALRRHLGSVSAQVVAEAPCTVTVVRI